MNVATPRDALAEADALEAEAARLRARALAALATSRLTTADDQLPESELYGAAMGGE